MNLNIFTNFLIIFSSLFAKNLKDQHTVPIDEIISAKNARAWVSMNFIEDKFSAPRTIEKMKILGALLELPAK